MTERRRTAARRIGDLLERVRALPADARNFALFELRDDLARLGIDPKDIDAFDAADDDALDRSIAALSAEDGDATSVHAERPPLSGLVGGLRNFAQKLQQPEVDGLQQMWIDDQHARRGKPVAYDRLPATYDYSALNDQFAKTTTQGAGLGREIFHAIRRDPFKPYRLTDRTVGEKDGANAKAMYSPYSYGGHHNHPSQGVDWKTKKPYVGNAVSGGDARNLIASGALFTIAQDGDEQTMFVRTDRTPNLNSKQQDTLRDEHSKRVEKYYYGDMSWRDANLRAAKETAARYGLGFYEGRGGIFKRVPTDK